MKCGLLLWCHPAQSRNVASHPPGLLSKPLTPIPLRTHPLDLPPTRIAAEVNLGAWATRSQAQLAGRSPPHQPAPRSAPAVTKLSRTVATAHAAESSARCREASDDATLALMDAAGSRGKSASISSSSNSTSTYSNANSDVTGPFVLRDGRPYLRDAPYPLPCDLPELQRQNLHTLLVTKAFGQPLCSPNILQNPPKRALEIACGSAYWSSLAHDHLASLGLSRVSFTGIDIVNLAPDLNKQGIDWRFVQHDVRHVPFPFDDGEFDLVMIKDISLVCPQGTATQRLLDEAMRILSGGGTLEIWESDHTIRSLMPHPAPPPGRNRLDQERAVATGTFLISPMTPFTQPENSFLRNSNAWIEEALDRRRLGYNPCTRVAQALLQEPESLCDVSYLRIAIPLGKVWWDRKTGAMPEAVVVGPEDAKEGASEESDEDEEEDEDDSDEDSTMSTDNPVSLSQAALSQYVQMIESLEPFLKDVSGKNQEEWQRWWTWMMEDLLLRNGASSGECLELGSWWAKKVYN